jgi:hypothetical protein
MSDVTPAKPDDTGVTVKPLEWAEILPKLWGVDTALVSYRLHEHSDGMFGVSLDGDSLRINCPSLDDAKAAAQADYEARIRSAISPTKQEETPVNRQIGEDVVALRSSPAPLQAQTSVPAGTTPPTSIRDAALEEAAQMADAFAKDDGVDPASIFGAGGKEFASQIASAIRILKGRDTIYREMAEAASPAPASAQVTEET